MPGNEVGDRVHNFFAQDNLSQGHHSPVVDGNWPSLSDNLSVGGQRQIGLPNSNAKNYYLQNPDTGREQGSYPFNGQHGLNFTQSIPRPEFAKSQSQNQQQNLNGFMHGNQFYQTRQDEANFLGVDTSSDQRNMASRGSPFYESQQGLGSEQQARAPVRSEPSESPVSFDLFGGQQMTRQQSNMLHSLQRQQSGLNNVQHLQHQVMFMKMQELQRQQQLQQLEARHQNTANQVSSFPEVASGVHSPALVNGTANFAALNYPPATELGHTNWLQRGSPVHQGSLNGLTPTNNSQAQRLVGLMPQQIDQSLYGVPVSNSRPALNQFSQQVTDKPVVQPMPTFNSSFPVNQYAALDQVSGQDGTLVSRQRFQGENIFGHAPSQALTNAINMENLQQADSLQKSSAPQDFRGRQNITVSSETSQEQAMVQASSSQNEVGLDPTEERILFGSDDNIWAAFGKSPVSGEGGNPFDDAGLQNGFPSLQGGTWSALMQSAVAETSSSDIGLQEEWSGPHFHSTEIPPGSQNLIYNSGRQKTSAEDNLPLVSSMNSASVQPSDSINMYNSYHNVQGHRFPFEPGRSLQENSSQRLVQSSDEGNKWSGFGSPRKSVAEASQMFRNTSNPLETELIAKKVSSPLAPEHGVARQQHNKSAGWSILGSAMPSGDAALSGSSEKSSKRSQDNNQKKFIQGEVHGGGGWKPNPGCNSIVGMEHLGSSGASPQSNSEVFSLHNSVTVPNSSTTRSGEETSLFNQNNYQSNYRKNADPLVKSKVIGRLGVLQPHATKDNQLLHSSLDIGDKEVKMHDMENSDKKEDSNDSHRSNLSRHSSAGLRENVLSDTSDSRCLPTGKQKLSNQVKNSWPHKFQYHPMGNLDEDAGPSYGMKHHTHSQPMVQQNANRDQSKLFGQGQSSDILVDGKGFGEVHPPSRFPGGGSNMPAPFNRSVDLPPNKAAQSSPNMLQLLQKVDHSREHGSMAYSSNSEHKASPEMPEVENSDGSAGQLQRSQSSAPQGFGLQLGPPSQRTSLQNNSLSQNPIRPVRSSPSNGAAIEIGEKSLGQMPPPHQAQSFRASSDLLQEELKNTRSGISGSTSNQPSVYNKMPGNFSSAFELGSGFPYSRSQLQNHHMSSASGQDSTNQSITVSFDEQAPHSTEKVDTIKGTEAFSPDGAGDSRNITQDNLALFGKSQLSNANGPYKRVSTNQVSAQEPLSVSQSFSTPDIFPQGGSSKMFTNVWTNFPQPQHLFGAQYSKEPTAKHQPHQLNIMESSLSAPERQGVNKGGTFTSELGGGSGNSLGSVDGEEQIASDNHPLPSRNEDLVRNMNDSQVREPIVKNPSEGSPANSSMQRDIEAFGRSLKPNNLPHQSFSVQNQMRGMKYVETDPSNRALERTRVPDSSLGTQQVPSGDSRKLTVTGPENMQRIISSHQEGTMNTQDAFRQDESQANFHHNSTSSVKPEQTQVSPHMAPTWFNQYGTLKNGQMLQMYDAHRAAVMKTAEQPFTLGKSSVGLHTLNSMQQVMPATADRSQIGNLGPSLIASSSAIEQFSSPRMLPVNVGQQHTVLKPKKRKRATSELTPWNKEVSLNSWNNQTISLAEIEWAKAANRITEKVEEDIDFIDDGRLRLKARRRLILTTQLMQLVFRSPPAAILCADANAEFEGVAYSVSRLALGDACSMVSCSDVETNMPHDGKKIHPENCKTLGRNSMHNFPKAMEELMGRVRKLESDFVRLDKRVSVLDLIVEGQDLEKFSVINRFAKFHGRGQSDGAETSSSSGAAAHSHKPLVQRYVTALPMPKNIPDRVQCLSL